MERLTTSIFWLLLAVSFVNAKANDVPRQNEDDTMRYSNHAALDYCQERQPKVSHFNTIDPKADQYPELNPYLYCAGDPMLYVDPTGELTLKYFNNKEPNNLILIKGFDYIPDDYLHQINICAHGWPKGINLFESGQKNPITTPKQFVEKVLSKNPIWIRRDKNEIMTIVLYSCRTAEGDNSFAQQLSEYLGENVVVIAPNQRVYCTSNGLQGVYKAKYVDENNNYLQGKSKESSDQPGEWLVFYKGEIINCQNGQGPPVIMDNVEMYKLLNSFNGQFDEK